MRLTDLSDELRAVAKARGPLRSALFDEAKELRSLPRYQSAADASTLIEADLRSVIADHLNERDRTYAQILFQTRGSSHTGLTARYEEISKTLYVNDRLVRGELLTEVVCEVAFQLALIGYGAHARYSNVSGFGYRYVWHDWSVTQFQDEPRRELYTFTTMIEATQPDQRFVVLGQSLFGSRIRSADVDNKEEGHRYVGHRPVVAGDPLGAVLHVVYLGRALDLGEPVVVTVIVDTEAPDDADEESSIEITAVSHVERITLRAHVPESRVSKYTRTRFPIDGPYHDRGIKEPVSRNGTEPMVYLVKKPERGSTYELAWQKPIGKAL